MNWRSLVWRIATRLAGPQPVNVNVNVRTSVSVRDPELPSPYAEIAERAREIAREAYARAGR